MIAISLWQPWASAIALGLKTFETRSWAAECPVGTRIAIHASLCDVGDKGEVGKRTRGWWMDLKRSPLEAAQHSLAVFAAAGYRDWCDLPLGAVVCTADFLGAHPTESIVEGARAKRGTSLEYLWGNYAPKRYAWELANVTRLDVPAPAKGWQNFFTWDPATNDTRGLPPAGRGRATGDRQEARV